MEKVIDYLLEETDTQELWDCLDSDDPLESFRNIWSLEGRIFDRFQASDEYLAEQMVEEYEKRTHAEHLMNEDFVVLKEMNGWAV